MKQGLGKENLRDRPGTGIGVGLTQSQGLRPRPSTREGVASGTDQVPRMERVLQRQARVPFHETVCKCSL